MKDVLHPLRVQHGKLFEWKKNNFPLYIERFRQPKAVYLVYTPEHGNLGDHAIAESEIQMLNELGIPFIEVNGRKLGEWREKGLLHVMNGRPIIINGGGNLGTIWPEIENTIRAIIECNPRSGILICPSTFFYEPDENGQLELERSIQIYNRHQHLKVYARERESFEKMKRVYRNVSLAPDMVFRLDQCREENRRHGGILCLRNDREKTRSVSSEKIIFEQIKLLFGDDIQTLDIRKNYPIPTVNREKELDKLFDAFRRSSLVVTDRLHAMIFCAITGTPCIVIDSKSPKVRGCYEWIKDLPYIRFCDNVTQIEAIYRGIPQQEWKYDNSKLLPLYEPLKQDILALAGKN